MFDGSQELGVTSLEQLVLGLYWLLSSLLEQLVIEY